MNQTQASRILHESQTYLEHILASELTQACLIALENPQIDMYDLTPKEMHVPIITLLTNWHINQVKDTTTAVDRMHGLYAYCVSCRDFCLKWPTHWDKLTGKYYVQCKTGTHICKRCQELIEEREAAKRDELVIEVA